MLHKTHDGMVVVPANEFHFKIALQGCWNRLQKIFDFGTMTKDVDVFGHCWVRVFTRRAGLCSVERPVHAASHESGLARGFAICG